MALRCPGALHWRRGRLWHEPLRARHRRLLLPRGEARRADGGSTGAWGRSARILGRPQVVARGKAGGRRGATLRTCRPPIVSAVARHTQQCLRSLPAVVFQLAGVRG